MNYGHFDRLVSIAGKKAVSAGEPMRKHTSFRIGGPADYFVVPENIAVLKAVLSYGKEEGLSVFVMGNGTNLLVSDEGFKGIIVSTGGLSCMMVSGSCITAQSGVLLSELAEKAASLSLSGLEFAKGIPGSVGGGVYMNAGAYDSEMKNVVLSAEILTADGEIKTFSNEELKLGYRTSVLAENGGVVLSTVFSLMPGSEEKIREKMQGFQEARSAKQPLEYPSAGSAFKRPAGYFAGKLITDAGLKGYAVGGACVSEKHAGFIINKGGASCSDVKTLIQHIIDKVYEKEHVVLEPEIKFL